MPSLEILFIIAITHSQGKAAALEYKLTNYKILTPTSGIHSIRGCRGPFFIYRDIPRNYIGSLNEVKYNEMVEYAVEYNDHSKHQIRYGE